MRAPHAPRYDGTMKTVLLALILSLTLPLAACGDDDDGDDDAPAVDAAPGTPDAAHDDTDSGTTDPQLDAKCTPGFDLNLEDTDETRRALFMDAAGGDPEAFVQEIGRGVCHILYRTADEVRDATHLQLIIRYAPGEVAWKAGDGADITVMISTDHLTNVKNQGRDVATEVKGILFHEMTHMYQHDDHDGHGADAGLIEGIADFVRIKAGFTPDGAQPSGGGNWNDGYTHTAFFLLYVDQAYPGFAHDLNLSMDSDDGKTWSPAAFQDITGKPVETLWDDYKAQL
jgi:hypothetical protein